jgi:hypothetical protein
MVNLKKKEPPDRYGWGLWPGDNPQGTPMWLRVMKYEVSGCKAMSEPMLKEDAIQYCLNIIRLTDGELQMFEQKELTDEENYVYETYRRERQGRA